MDRRGGKEGRRKDRGNLQYSEPMDYGDTEVMVVDDEEDCNNEVKLLDEEVKLIREPPLVVLDRSQRRLARDGVGRTELLVTGLPPTVTEAEIWMTASMGPRDGPRPSRVEVMSSGRDASALLGFKSTQYAEKFRTLHLAGFLGGRIQVKEGAQQLEREIQPTRGVSKSGSNQIRAKSRSPRHKPPKKPVISLSNNLFPHERLPVLEKLDHDLTVAAIQAKTEQGPSSRHGIQSQPPRDPKSTISVKTNIFLKGPSESDLKAVLETVKNDMKQPKSLLMRKQSVEKDVKIPWEPIIVDIVETEGVITKIRVFRVTHNKVQDFFGQNPDILWKAALKYVRRYFPVPSAQQLILVTMSPPSFGLLLSTLSEAGDLAFFNAVFAYWTCLAWLVRPWARLRAILPSKFLLNDLVQQMQLTVKEREDRLVTMGRLVDACMPDWSKERLPCKVDGIQDCRIVLVYVGVLQILVNGVLVPAIGSLGFRTSDRGSWFVTVEPDEREGKVDASSASKLGLRREDDGRWISGKDGSACLTDRTALRSFLDSLGQQQVILITPRRSNGIETLIAGLQKHGMVDELVKKVAAIGCVEDMAASLNSKTFSDPSQIFEFCSEMIDRKVEEFKAEQVPLAMLHLLEKMFPSLTSEYLGPHIHPLVSPYTHSLLLSSPIPTLLSSCNQIYLTSPVSLQPGGQHLVTLRLSPSGIQDVGYPLTMIGDLGLELYSEVNQLSSSLKVTATIRNAGSDVLQLLEGERVGLAWREDTELMTSTSTSAEPGFSECYIPDQVGGTVAGCNPDVLEGNENLDKEARVAAIRKEIAKLEAKLLVEGGVHPRKTSVLDKYLKKKAQINAKKSTKECRNSGSLTSAENASILPTCLPATVPTKEEYSEATIRSPKSPITANHDRDDSSTGEGSSTQNEPVVLCRKFDVKQKRIVLAKRDYKEMSHDEGDDVERPTCFAVGEQDLEVIQPEQGVAPHRRSRRDTFVVTSNSEVETKRVKLSFADESDTELIAHHSEVKESEVDSGCSSKEENRRSRCPQTKGSISSFHGESTEIELEIVEQIDDASDKECQRQGPEKSKPSTSSVQIVEDEVEVIGGLADETIKEKQSDTDCVVLGLNRNGKHLPSRLLRETREQNDIIEVEQTGDKAKRTGGHQRGCSGKASSRHKNVDTEDIDIHERDSRSESFSTARVCLHGTEGVHTIEDQEVVDLAEDVEVVQVDDESSGDVSSADEEDTIEILPVQGNKIHFVNGCAVADPESLRQNIEKYNRRKKEKAAAQALLVLAKQTESSECELEILDNETQSTNTSNTEDEIQRVEGVTEEVPDDITLDKNFDPDRRDSSPRDGREEEAAGPTGNDAQHSIPAKRQNKIYDCNITPECQDSHILELAPAEDGRSEDCAVQTECDRQVVSNVSDKADERVVVTEELKEDPENIDYCCSRLDKKTEDTDLKTANRDAEAAEESEPKDCDDHKSLQDHEKDDIFFKMAKIHPEGNLQETTDGTETTGTEEEEETPLSKVDYDPKEGEEGNSDDNGENEAAYHDAYSIVRSLSNNELEMSSSDEESLECKPDLESLVQFEAKKKIELRKQKAEGHENKDVLYNETGLSEPEHVAPDHLKSVKNSLPKKESPWILTSSSSSDYVDPRAPERIGPVESNWKPNATMVQGKDCCESETAKRKLIILEQRNTFNMQQDESSDGEAITAPNSDVDESPLETKLSQLHGYTSEGTDEERCCPNSSSLPTDLHRKQKVSREEIIKREEANIILMEKPEQNEFPSIQILNSKSVTEKERILCGPINKVPVEGKLYWQCDICLKTIKAWAAFLEHLNGHYLVNSFFCPNCDASFKTNRNMKRHQQKCQPQEEQDMEMEDQLIGMKRKGNGSESESEGFDDPESHTSRDNTPDLLMTNVTTLQPGDSEAAEVRDDESQESASSDEHVPKKEVLDDEIEFSEDEQDCSTNMRKWSRKPRIDLVKRELIEEEEVGDVGMILEKADEELPNNDENCKDIAAESDKELRGEKVASSPRNYKRHRSRGSNGKPRRFTGMGSSPGTLMVRPKRVKLTFVDDAEVFQMESFHYKTLAEKMTTEIAIVKYVSARPESKRLIQEKAKLFKRELVYSDDDSEGENITSDCNNSDSGTKYVEGPAWVLPIDPACPVVSQLRILVKQHFSSDDINANELCFEFPSLLSNPEFEPLIQTYLRYVCLILTQSI